LEYAISKDNLVQKLELMDKANLDKVYGFIKCLIVQRSVSQQNTNKRKPLLTRRSQDE
jgi:hypothetical protein